MNRKRDNKEEFEVMGTAGKQKRFRRVSVTLVLTLVLAGIFSYVPVVQSKAPEDMQ